MEVVIALFFIWSVLLILTLLMFAAGKRSDVSRESQPKTFPPVNSRPIAKERQRNPYLPRLSDPPTQVTGEEMRRPVVRPR